MTKSTGKRAAQKRREELIAGELWLRRTRLHLMDASARLEDADLPYRALDYVDARGIVESALFSVMKEGEALPR